MNESKKLVDEYQTYLEAFKNEMLAKTKDLMRTLIVTILSEDFPNHNITWTQYTPYFNDGDECIFGVNDVRIVPDSEEEEDLSPEERSADNSSSYAFDALTTLLYGAEEIMKAAFGDHAEITVRLVEGEPVFEVDGYYHD